ncbi:MAG: PAS domain-containing protein [Rhodocyclales bacterium]|nr:PAS domain-containing protein [Rhodocyclales bacterium]
MIVIWFWGVLGLLLVLLFVALAVVRKRDTRHAEFLALLAKLKESENRLRAIIEAEPECVKLLDAEGRIIEINPAGLALVDACCPEDVLGQSIYDTVAPEHIENYKEQVHRVFSGESVAFEYRVLTLGGREAWHQSHACPLRDANGKIIAYLSVTRDVTVHKQAEDQAQRHQTELARVARMSAIGEMATGIAHELNQPLAAIANFAKGSVRRLQAGNLTHEETHSVLHDIGTQAERAGEVLRHIRDFARKRNSLPRLVHMNALIASAVRLTEHEIRQHGVTIALDLNDSLPAINADPIMVEQMLCNLIRNAVEAMTQAGSTQRRIVIRTHPSDAGGIEVEVSDSGPGMSEEVAQQVFDQFFSTKPEGMGMGLSISRSIIETYGGRLWLETAPGCGASFHFRIPAAQSLKAVA